MWHGRGIAFVTVVKNHNIGCYIIVRVGQGRRSVFRLTANAIGATKKKKQKKNRYGKYIFSYRQYSLFIAEKRIHTTTI